MSFIKYIAIISLLWAARFCTPSTTASTAPASSSVLPEKEEIRTDVKVHSQTSVQLSAHAAQSINSLISQGLEQGTFPGAVVLVAKDSTVLFRKAYGYREVWPKKVPMTEDTLFDLASMTKCVGTATAVMKLMEEGRIGLHDPVKKYIPDFKPWTDGRTTVDITVQQLLTHSSGLPAGISVAEANQLRTEWKGHNTEKFVHHIAVAAKRNFRPGTRELYSCLNFIVLQGIVEKVSGMRLSDYADAAIFRPLGMRHTRFFAEEEAVPATLPIAATTKMKDAALKGRVHDPLARLLNGGVSGNAGLFSNVDDLAKFCFFMLYGNDRVLRCSTLDLMTTIPAADAKEVGRALGWEVNSSYAGPFKQNYCICHTGYTGTSMVIDLKTKTTILLLTNRVHPADLPAHKKELMAIRRGLADIVAAEIIK